jgi:predicted O-methyltransferase YrrM
MPVTIKPCPHPLVERVYSAQALPLESGGTTPLNVYIPREQGDYLYSLVRHYKPALTIEVGMANGLSTLFISSAHADNGLGGRHIAIDPYQRTDWKNVGIGLIRQAGLVDHIRLIELPSHQALPDLEREEVRANLVFIDGAHLTDYVFTDALCSDRLLGLNGLLAFDDSDWPAVQPVIRYFLANRHYEPAYPEIVIEPPPGRPSFLGRMLCRVPVLQDRLRPDFLRPARGLGIVGRCVVLRKLKADDRNSQKREEHQTF